MSERAGITVKGPLRCPFCHDRIDLNGQWVACSRCLARHHDECWEDGRKCGACGGTSALVPEERRQERRQSSSRANAVGPEFAAAESNVTGFWKGKLDMGVGLVPIEVDLVQAGSEFSGYWFRGSARGHVRHGRVSGFRVSFEVASGDDEVWYEGRLLGKDTMSGRWRLDDDETGDFTLKRVGRS